MRAVLRSLAREVVTEDPARDGGNWLVYCNNDPVDKVDVDGRSACWARFLPMLGVRVLGEAPESGATEFPL